MFPEKFTKIEAGPVNNTLNDAQICIFYTKPANAQPMKVLLENFLQIINGLIGAKTNVNYHITPVVNNRIIIPIYPYTNDEITLNVKALISKRYKTILTYLNGLDLKSFNQNGRWIIRSLMKLSKSIFSEGFKIKATVSDDIFSEDPLKFNFDDILNEEYKQYKMKDGSKIGVLIDPYSTSYGLFIDLSIKFEEMGMGYNALHLYEHLSTKAWVSHQSEHVIDLNGSTFPTGISFVYIILNNFNAFKEHVNASINWIKNSRKLEFWSSPKIKKFIEIETQRTISETREERVLNTIGRTDPKGFNYQYNTNIFHYWANRPFNILLTTPKDLPLRLKSFKSVPVRRPPNLTFDRMPLDVLKAKCNSKLCIQRAALKSNIKEVLEDSLTNSLYGINCKMGFIDATSKDELRIYNSILFPLLFLVRYIPPEKVKEYISSHYIPLSASELYMTPLCFVNKNDIVINKFSCKLN
jgi:hypothetical protein